MSTLPSNRCDPTGVDLMQQSTNSVISVSQLRAPNRLALGTVQFGLPYGIANEGEQVSRAEIAAIIARARAHGVDTLDTAVAYGDSEQRLGEIGMRDWRVISKLPALPDDCPDVTNWVRATVSGSLTRLKIPCLNALLMHRPRQLLDARGDQIYAALQELKEEAKVEKIGISIYDPAELDEIGGKYSYDLVQTPFNILDRRIVTSGWLDRLNQAGTEVHARSVFLQGLLLMGQKNRPVRFTRWQALWREWDLWLAENGADPLSVCLNVAFSQSGFARVIIGVDGLRHWNEILSALARPAKSPPPSLVSADPDLINPSRWNTQ